MIAAGDIIKRLGEDEIIILANAMDVGAVKIIVKLLKGIRDEERQYIEEHPRMDDADIRNDWRYKVGSISRMNDVLSLPQVARQIVEKRG